ncbi:MAG: hypothetical protein ACE5KF_03180 [Kiloniellaceae bacterium]
MARQLRIRPLTPDRIAQAYPLVQAALPEVSLGDWRDFAAPLVSPKAQPDAGIITVISERDYIAGLCSYHIAHDLRHGPALIADHFLALDLFDQRAVVHALAEAIESLAKDRLCTAIHTNLPETGAKISDGWLIRLLGNRGHRIESLRMCKVLRHTA